MIPVILNRAWWHRDFATPWNTEKSTWQKSACILHVLCYDCAHIVGTYNMWSKVHNNRGRFFNYIYSWHNIGIMNSWSDASHTDIDTLCMCNRTWCLELALIISNHIYVTWEKLTWPLIVFMRELIFYLIHFIQLTENIHMKVKGLARCDSNHSTPCVRQVGYPPALLCGDFVFLNYPCR